MAKSPIGLSKFLGVSFQRFNLNRVYRGELERLTEFVPGVLETNICLIVAGVPIGMHYEIASFAALVDRRWMSNWGSKGK
jgi:hypothetical protein